MRFSTTAAIFLLAASAAFAQQGPPGGYRPDPPPTPPSTQNNPPLVTETRAPKSTPKAPARDEILRDAAALAKSAPVSCDVTDAALLNDGMANIYGQMLHVRTFELACGNGMGYFLVEQPPEKTTGFSCFAADAVRAQDPTAPVCTLPANSDRKAMAAAILSKLGLQCQVNDVRRIGQEVGKNTELVEVACTGGNGFVLSGAAPGSTAAASAMTCPDSYRRGVPCKLSSNGAPLVTLQTFKDALAQHHVACNAEVVRAMGKETKLQRHLVEFKCPAEFPNGLVALIPLEGNTAPFETMDCAQAASRYHTICALTPPH